MSSDDLLHGAPSGSALSGERLVGIDRSSLWRKMKRLGIA